MGLSLSVLDSTWLASDSLRIERRVHLRPMSRASRRHTTSEEVGVAAVDSSARIGGSCGVFALTTTDGCRATSPRLPKPEGAR